MHFTVYMGVFSVNGRSPYFGVGGYLKKILTGGLISRNWGILNPFTFASEEAQGSQMVCPKGQGLRNGRLDRVPGLIPTLTPKSLECHLEPTGWLEPSQACREPLIGTLPSLPSSPTHESPLLLL